MKAQKQDGINYVRFFSDIDCRNASLVGVKNANLGEMYQRLGKKNIRIPNGFAITVEAYDDFVAHNKIGEEINRQLTRLNPNNLVSLQKKGATIRHLISSGEFPPELERQVSDAYSKLAKAAGSGRHPGVAVRSSIYADEAPDSAFAGQLDTYLNVSGKTALLKAVKAVMSSLYTDRAIAYCAERGYRHEKQLMSVGVQLMVRSDSGSAGTLYTYDFETGLSNVIIVNSAYGLGISVVEGKTDPDEFTIFKPTIKHKHPAIISKKLGPKQRKIIFDKQFHTKTLATTNKERSTFSLQEQEVLKLAKWGLEIERYFNSPMHVEWAKDGRNNKLYVVQAGKERVREQSGPILKTYKLKHRPQKVLATGTSVGRKIGQGKAHVIVDNGDLKKFKKGEILVTNMTEPDWEPILKKAKAIVTDSGGRTAHAAIVSRELGIPAIVGTQFGTEAIKTGTPITVDCSQGELGLVYEGITPYETKETNLRHIPRTEVEVMLNVGEPSQAFQLAQLPCDGVGLARIEFILNEQIKTHPLSLLKMDKLKNEQTRDKIINLMKEKGYREPKKFFIEQLSEGIARIATAFYPSEVVVRLSDFKSNEYRHLLGGDQFEPVEQNPMLGWRGAARYYDLRFKEAFAMECAAFRRVRDEMGLTNVSILVPFVRTVDEAEKVLKVLKVHGLVRGKDKLKIYMMTEIPSNIVLAEKFSKLFDGFSIGSNDLTQLVLGVDRGSDLVSHIYDENNEAIMLMLKDLIQVAHNHKRKVSICGQAPSDFPDFAEFLAREGIDAISVNPDALLRTKVHLSKVKKKKKK